MYKIVLKGGREIAAELDGDFYVYDGEVARSEFAGVRVVDEEGREVLAGAVEVEAMTEIGGRPAVWLEAVPEDRLAILRAEANIEYLAMMTGVEL